MAEFGIPQIIQCPLPGSTIFLNDFTGIAVDDPDLEEGNGFLVQSVSGRDYPKLRTNVSDLPRKDGGYVHKSWKGAKVIIIRGVLFASNPVQRQILSEGLAGCLDPLLEAEGYYFWQPHGATIRFHTVQLYEAVDVTGTANDVKTFTITLLATPEVNT